MKEFRAAVKFIESRGWEVYDYCWGAKSDIIAYDNEDETYHFINVQLHTMEEGFGDKEEENELRPLFEKDAYTYSAPLFVEGKIVFDVLSLIVMEGNRAMVRFHSNILGY